MSGPSRSRWRTSRWLRGLRRGLDDWFGTIARWSGLLLLGYAVFFDRLHNPALIPAATGLMFLKNVTGAGKD